MRGKELLFYDIEVFLYDTLVVFEDIDHQIVGIYWNHRGRQSQEEPSGFEGLPDLIKDKILVGYNNYHYDDCILSLLLNQATSMQYIVKASNDRIIAGEGFSGKISPLIHSLDTMQQIDVSRPSLKQIEGNMGRSILESEIDFQIDRPLTDEERAVTVKYCAYDVESTIEVFKLRRKSYFRTKDSLLALLPEEKREKAVRWNTTTISAMILTGGKETRWWEQTMVEKLLGDRWRKVPGIPEEVWDMWEALTESPEATMGKGKSKTIRAFGCSIVFGLGGLHGAPTKPLRAGKCRHKDVKSMYPSAICHLNALGEATGVYDSMRQERIQIKHTDTTRAAALKLILNSVYGNFKNSYSTLCNPLASSIVCIYGMIALFSLCRELSQAGYRILNINTDGVVYGDRPELEGKDDEICNKWEKDFEGFSLETDEYTQWIQKDVNNYIAVSNDQITVKGGDVNKYQQNKYFSNNNARIIQIAMVEKLVSNTPVLTTLVHHLDDPLLWQYVLKAGGTFQGVCDSNGDLQNKVNRVFAANEGAEYTRLYKLRKDGGKVNFPDAPDRMFLWNGDVRDLPNEDFRKMIDLGHYYTMTNEKLKGWPQDVYG